MSWRTEHLTVTFEGAPTADFDEEETLSVTVAMMFFYPVWQDLSESMEYVNRRLARGTADRPGWHAVTADFALQAKDADADTMDHGRYQLMRHILKKMPHRRIASTTGYNQTGVIPVAAELADDDDDGANTHFVGLFPQNIIVEDDLALEPAPGGLARATFDLWREEADL